MLKKIGLVLTLTFSLLIAAAPFIKTHVHAEEMHLNSEDNEIQVKAQACSCGVGFFYPATVRTENVGYEFMCTHYEYGKDKVIYQYEYKCLKCNNCGREKNKEPSILIGEYEICAGWGSPF